jgi:hypothetical protein
MRLRLYASLSYERPDPMRLPEEAERINALYRLGEGRGAQCWGDAEYGAIMCSLEGEAGPLLEEAARLTERGLDPFYAEWVNLVPLPDDWERQLDAIWEEYGLPGRAVIDDLQEE